MAPRAEDDKIVPETKRIGPRCPGGAIDIARIFHAPEVFIGEAFKGAAVGVIIDMRKRFLALAIIISLMACMPTVSRRIHAPKVSGTLIQDGRPVANAEILLTASFTDAKASSRTDSEGRFLVGPLSETQFAKRVLGDRVHVYKLDIRVAEQPYLGLEIRGMGDPPNDLEVACDLSHPIRQGKSVSYCSANSRTAPEKK